MERKIIEADGVELVTFSKGDARHSPVLLVHGFGSTAHVNWVNTGWVETLTGLGRRVITFDHRGHGQSGKLYHPEAYTPEMMAEDARHVLDAYGIEQADVMGYSMGGRIASYLALAHPQRVGKLILGGIGYSLINTLLDPKPIEAALRAPSLDAITDPAGRMFRQFADANGQDRDALAACIVGSRKAFPEERLADIFHPTMVAVGTRDTIAGDGALLASRLPNGLYIPIPNREHNPAVGDKIFKQAVGEFLLPT